MAEVFLAKAAGPMGFEKTLVLKRILPHLAEEPAFVEMFLSEAKLAAQLTHPHIVQIFDFGEADGSYFLAMEYIDGPNLRTLVKRASAQGVDLPLAVCARLVAHACDGLAFAHDFTDPQTGEALELIHRDISPDNILLSRQGAVKVVDFGIAKAAGQSHKTRSGVIKGKLAYMPPEQVRAEPLDRRVDVYALGVVLYELLTAHKPFEAESDVGLMHAILTRSPMPAVQFRPDLPDSLRRILGRALAKDREQRYPDCHAFQSDLEEFILSVGKPVTMPQIAQLITQVSSSTDHSLPVVTQGTTHQERKHSVTPVHTPAPPITRTDAGAPSTPATTRVSRPRLTPVPVAAPPSPSEEMLTEQERALVRRLRFPVKELALGGFLLIAAGSGVVLWRSIAAPKPEEAVARVQPFPELEPSTPDAGPPASASASPTPNDEKANDESASAPAPVPPKPQSSSRGGGSSRSKRAVWAKYTGPKGTLEFHGQLGVTVFVDGEELGDLPLRPVNLPAGPHIVTFFSQRLSKHRDELINVREGETTLLQVSIQKE
ncbi:protein kinase [Archangium violaceum]|uniref:serine/threonine protein kinase n=1 Tax=Archangium violaceum TaxID=83451 RepID=UPI0037BF2474